MGEHKIFLRETNWVRKESCEKKNRRQNIKIFKNEKGEVSGWKKISVRVKQKVWLRKKKVEVKINKVKLKVVWWDSCLSWKEFYKIKITNCITIQHIITKFSQ